MKYVSFGKEFFFGAATASYQVEGGIENNDWAKAAREGKVPRAGDACDHYNRFVGDFAIAKSLGHNAHRISIEWARIEPFEGQFDEREIEHYRQVVAALRAFGIEPFVTLWHFTLPTWFSESGAWTRKDASNLFARYSAYVVSSLGRSVRFWVTINEPLVYASNGYLKGRWPPFKKNMLSFLSTFVALERAHVKAYQWIKEIDPNAQIGIAKHNINFEHDGRMRNRFAAFFMNWFWNRRFIRRTRKFHDFIGLNYYFHKKFGEKKCDYPASDMGWHIYPKGLYNLLMDLNRFDVPLYVLENGLADRNDKLRTDFIKDSLSEVFRARNDGVDVRGYFHWSLMDNFEWAEGFSPCFGLVEIDYKNFNRRIRPSAYVYRDLIEEYERPVKPKISAEPRFRRIFW